MFFYVLATSKVMSEWVSTCDCLKRKVFTFVYDHVTHFIAQLQEMKQMLCNEECGYLLFFMTITFYQCISTNPS